MWEVSNTQIQSPFQVNGFAAVGIYAPLPTSNYSELFVTGTLENNVSRPILCIVNPNNRLITEESEVVQLLVYGE